MNRLIRLSAWTMSPKIPTIPSVRRWIAAAALVAMIVISGCDAVPIGRSKSDDGVVLPDPVGSGLVAAERTYIADVPLPVGFVPVPSRGTSYVPPKGPRSVDHTYQGLANIADTTRFYRQHLPVQGWQFVNERADGTVTTMSYVKGEESLLVEVSNPRVLDVIVRIRDRNAAMVGGAMKP